MFPAWKPGNLVNVLCNSRLDALCCAQDGPPVAVKPERGELVRVKSGYTAPKTSQVDHLSRSVAYLRGQEASIHGERINRNNIETSHLQ